MYPSAGSQARFRRSSLCRFSWFLFFLETARKDESWRCLKAWVDADTKQRNCTCVYTSWCWCPFTWWKNNFCSLKYNVCSVRCLISAVQSWFCFAKKPNVTYSGHAIKKSRLLWHYVLTLFSNCSDMAGHHICHKFVVNWVTLLTSFLFNWPAPCCLVCPTISSPDTDQ